MAQPADAYHWQQKDPLYTFLGSDFATGREVKPQLSLARLNFQKGVTMVYIDFKSGNWRFVQAHTNGFALVQKFKTKTKAVETGKRYLESGAIKELTIYKRNQDAEDWFESGVFYTDASKIPVRIG